MADPLSISASIIAVLKLTGVTIKYLKDVHDAPADRLKFLAEISGLENLLLALQRRAEGQSTEGPWVHELQALGVKDGPLDQLRTCLDRLQSKLKPLSGHQEIGRRLTWTFTKTEITDILSRIERIKTLTSLALGNELVSFSSAINVTVTKTQLDIETKQKNQAYQRIIDWLSPLDFTKSQSEIFRKRQGGTGQWLLESKEFQDWCDGMPETLWCPGMPGAGKSVLTSIVVNHLQTLFEDADVAIAYVYCNYKEQAEQTDANIIAGLLKQIVPDSGMTFTKLETLYELHEKKKTRPGLDEFTAVLKSQIGMYPKAFILVDALDECNEGTRTTLLRTLWSLPGTVNLMLTSRYLSSIEADLQGLPRLDIRANDQDLQMYIAGRIACMPRQHLIALQERIINQVIENADGMFLLAQLHMDSVVNKHSPAAVRNALENLTKHVDDAYDEAMQRIEQQDQDDRTLAERILSWITYAFRPLSVTELQHALAVIPTTPSMDLEHIIDEDILTSVCAGLVIIDKEHGIIRLVHYTTQQYFECHRANLFPNAPASIAATCLTYLSFDVFRKGYCYDDAELKDILGDNPLLDYAAHHWGDHAHGHIDGNTRHLIKNFLQDDSKVACASQVLLIPQLHKYPGYSQHFPRRFSGLHMSSFFGLTEIVKYQLENGLYADSRDNYKQTPLSWAAARGHKEVVRVLIEQDNVEMNSKDNYGQTPLFRAAGEGQVEVVRLLMEQDNVEVNSKDNYGQTPLYWAAITGHHEVVRVLVEHGNVQVDSKDNYGQTPLSKAAEEGQVEVVRLLIEQYSVEVNSKDHHGQTPLFCAAAKGHQEVVRVLVEQDNVEVNSKDKYGLMPLSRAAEEGQVEVVRFLIEQDNVEVDSRDNYGWTPLSRAAEAGQVEVVRLLIEQDNVEVDSKDNHGQTPLSRAAESGQVEVVRLLIDQGNVEVDSKDSHGQTPLLRAAASGYHEIVKVLVEQDNVEMDSKDNHGRTPLSWAAARGHQEVVKVLVDQVNVEVNSKDNYGRTPLSWAAARGHHKVVRLLVENNNVEVDSKDSHGRIPLSWAAARGHQEVVRLLVQQDNFEVDYKDNDGQTPLSWAAARGHQQVVRLLVEQDGVEVESKDNHRRTPLSWAAARGHQEVVRVLVEQDSVEVDSKDNHGRTPLSWAAAHGHQEVVRLLAWQANVVVNSNDNHGQTPLSRAAARGHHEVVRLLVEHNNVKVDAGLLQGAIKR